jgi:hypothetical protein
VKRVDSERLRCDTSLHGAHTPRLPPRHVLIQHSTLQEKQKLKHFTAKEHVTMRGAADQPGGEIKSRSPREGKHNNSNNDDDNNMVFSESSHH